MRRLVLIVPVFLASVTFGAFAETPVPEKPAVEKPASDTPASPSATTSDEARTPDELSGKSIVINFRENRKARIDGDQLITRKIPFRLLVYVSTRGNVFNRLLPGRSGKHIDQVLNKGDDGKSAPSEVIFGQNTMTVRQHFAYGRGIREIRVSFDGKYASCKGEASMTLDDPPFRHRLPRDRIEEMYSATMDAFTCSVKDGNVLASDSSETN